MNTPAWFDPEHYWHEKYLSLVRDDPAWTMGKMYRALYDAGFSNPYDHYVAYGDAEGISPNALFDEHAYLRNKAQQMGLPGGESLVADLIRAAGMTLAEHYDLYGFREGVNPSDSFDQSKYLQAKLYAMQSRNSAYTLDKLVRALDAADMTPVEHYLLYAEQEGLTEADANAAGYSYSATDTRPVADPNKTSGFEYTIDYNSRQVHTLTVEQVLTETDADGVINYILTKTTVDLTETTEITDVTITGSTTMDLSDVLAMLGHV
jgi:hypothetical protein